MKFSLVLVAAGGHAAEVLTYLEDLQRTEQSVELRGAVDDGVPAGAWESTQLLGGLNELARQHTSADMQLCYLTCVGNNSVRRKLVERIESMSIPIVGWTLVHPTAYIGRSVSIGLGTLLAPHTIVTTRTTIGKHCILNARAGVHHDCVIGDYVNVNPAATVCGAVEIGEESYIGAGATVINGRRIGKRVVVGAGAVVTNDLPDDVTAVGVPARIIKDRRC